MSRVLALSLGLGPHDPPHGPDPEPEEIVAVPVRFNIQDAYTAREFHALAFNFLRLDSAYRARLLPGRRRELARLRMELEAAACIIERDGFAPEVSS